MIITCVVKNHFTERLIISNIFLLICIRISISCESFENFKLYNLQDEVRCYTVYAQRRASFKLCSINNSLVRAPSKNQYKDNSQNEVLSLRCDKNTNLNFINIEDSLEFIENSYKRKIGFSSTMCHENESKFSEDSVNSSSLILDQLLYRTSCEDLFQFERAIASEVIRKCNGKNECMIWSFFGNYTNPLSNCDPDYQVIRKLELSYSCLPNEEKFLTRKLHYKDLTNEISCLTGRVLYIIRSRVTCNVKNHLHRNKNDEPLDEDYTMATNNVVQGEREILDKTSKNFDPKIFQILVATIISECHGKSSCSIKLSQLLGDFSNEHIRRLDWIAELDYLCIPELVATANSSIYVLNHHLQFSTKNLIDGGLIVEAQNEWLLNPGLTFGSKSFELDHISGQIMDLKYELTSLHIIIGISIGGILALLICLFLGIYKLKLKPLKTS